MVRAHRDVCIRRRKTGRAYSIKGRAREGFDSRFGMALPRVIVSILAVIAVRQTMMRMFGGRMLLLVVGKVNDAGRDGERGRPGYRRSILSQCPNCDHQQPNQSVNKKNTRSTFFRRRHGEKTPLCRATAFPIHRSVLSTPWHSFIKS